MVVLFHKYVFVKPNALRERVLAPVGPDYQPVYRSVYFLCFLLGSLVVFTVFRIQKMVVKDCELGYNILVTVSDVHCPLQDHDILFLNSFDWLGEVMTGHTSRSITAIVCGQR